MRNRYQEEPTAGTQPTHDVSARLLGARNLGGARVVLSTAGALFLLAVTAGCAFHRYNNSVVLNVQDSHQITTRIDRTEQLSEGTSQEKRLNDVGNPDISLPVVP